MRKVSKRDQDPHQTDEDKTEIDKILSKKSRHFEPGTWVVINNERFLVLCYSPIDGKMVLIPERTTLTLDDPHPWKRQ